MLLNFKSILEQNQVNNKFARNQFNSHTNERQAVLGSFQCFVLFFFSLEVNLLFFQTLTLILFYCALSLIPLTQFNFCIIFSPRTLWFSFFLDYNMICCLYWINTRGQYLQSLYISPHSLIFILYHNRHCRKHQFIVKSKSPCNRQRENN